ncbi:hypothetical protein Pelo_15974 [Pelomyxa schiedti]|nr:hypothetical protein Pelo_15974 [Pelomyxa schiedti]
MRLCQLASMAVPEYSLRGNAGCRYLNSSAVSLMSLHKFLAAETSSSKKMLYEMGEMQLERDKEARRIEREREREDRQIAREREREARQIAREKERDTEQQERIIVIRTLRQRQSRPSSTLVTANGTNFNFSWSTNGECCQGSSFDTHSSCIRRLHRPAGLCALPAYSSSDKEICNHGNTHYSSLNDSGHCFEQEVVNQQWGSRLCGTLGITTIVGACMKWPLGSQVAFQQSSEKKNL